MTRYNEEKNQQKFKDFQLKIMENSQQSQNDKLDNSEKIEKDH